MTLSNVLPVADQELLNEFHIAMLDQNHTIGIEFEQELEALGLNDVVELTEFFSSLLLKDGEHLIRISFEKLHGLNAHKVVSLFDSYLTCLSRRAASLMANSTKARRANDTLRKLAFHYLAIALEANAVAVQTMQDTLLFDRSTGILTQEGFVLSLDYLLETDPNNPFAILVVEFDCGTYPASFIASMQQEISKRIFQVVRDGDLIAQILPTRWVLGFYQIQSEAHANLAALKLKRLLDKPFEFLDSIKRVKTRIGIAMFPEHGKKAERLLQLAWTAAYDSSKNVDGIQFHSSARMDEGTYLNDLISKLHKSLFENLLELHYQPQFSFKENRVVGLEALLRWPLQDNKVPIPLIIEIIESENLVPQFTQWLLHTAFRNFSEFNRHSTDTTLSINLLPLNFNQPGLADDIAQAIDLWKVPANKIILELTEGSLLSDVDAAIRQIGRLKGIGVKISMDDFGTGYSSMSYLSRLDIDELKIDQSFIRSMLTSPKDLAIVRAIIDLAHNFNLEIVAEGVESPEMAKVLRDFGCDIIQGFWISRPLSPVKLVDWLKYDSLSQTSKLLV